MARYSGFGPWEDSSSSSRTISIVLIATRRGMAKGGHQGQLGVYTEEGGLVAGTGRVMNKRDPHTTHHAASYETLKGRCGRLDTTR